jgi:hypothetical protein
MESKLISTPQLMLMQPLISINDNRDYWINSGSEGIERMLSGGGVDGQQLMVKLKELLQKDKSTFHRSRYYFYNHTHSKLLIMGDDYNHSTYFYMSL